MSLLLVWVRVHSLSVKTSILSQSLSGHISIAESEGWVMIQYVQVVISVTFRVFEKDQGPFLQCNTEKDKERLHHRTVGITDTCKPVNKHT